MSTLRLVVVYPGLLGTYGDRGNALALRQRASLRGLAVSSHAVQAGEAVPEEGDVYLVGGGEDGAQALAAALLRADGGLARAVARGRTVLAVCAGMQLLGRAFPAADGTVRPGLDLVDATTRPLAARASGDLVVDAEVDGESMTLVGFENHRLGTRLGPACRPLGRVRRGVGNDEAAAVEGLVQGSIIGTYLHGPVLALNPALADAILRRIVGDLPAVDPDEDAWAMRARAVRTR